MDTVNQPIAPVDGAVPDRAATPSGKHAGSENFPVASFLIAARLRPHVMAFYGFARTIDDVADSPDLPAEEKLRRLDGYERAVTGVQPADPAYVEGTRCHESLTTCDITPRHCQDLVDAFRQDAVKTRYASWDELLDYCLRSAAPVGRYLLDLHGEDKALWPLSDALCNALQVINHLQDMAEDYIELDRVYVPEPLLAAEGLSVAVLGETAMPPALRRVVDGLLDNVDELLRMSAPLARRLRSRRLGMETAVIQALAVRLSRELRRNDPLAGPVKLDKLSALGTALAGVFTGFGR